MAEDEAALGTASAGLLAHFPQHPLGHYFAAIHAATKSDWLRADTEIDAAERLGLAHDGAQALRDSGVHRRAVAWRTGYTVMAALAVWAAGLLVLFAAGRYFSGATLRSIEVSDPNAPLSDRERALRQRYRVLVRAAGVYYYVSLPFVVVLVLATAGGVFAIFLWLGRLPIQLLLAVGVGALVTIYKMVQSLFVKVEHVESGRRLEPSEAPGLWRLVHEVAAAVDTRPVDEIRVTPGTDMAVYERGTSQEKERDQATRVLLIGVGLFEGFRQRALRAVVAHEYGHFSNRDTAGGDVALRVRLDMAKFGMAMVRHGQNTWWNVAFHFLRLYAVIFRRISHGATRLQEVLADRVAAQLYGPGPFEEGLRHAIRREVEFDALASREAERAARGRLSFTDVYGDTLPDDAGIDDAVAQLLARPTTDDDSHPSPVDRFRLVNRVVGAPTADDPGMVWDLFADPALLRAEMTALIDGNVKAQAAAV